MRSAPDGTELLNTRLGPSPTSDTAAACTSAGGAGTMHRRRRRHSGRNRHVARDGDGAELGVSPCVIHPEGERIGCRAGQASVGEGREVFRFQRIVHRQNATVQH